VKRGERKRLTGVKRAGRSDCLEKWVARKGTKKPVKSVRKFTVMYARIVSKGGDKAYDPLKSVGKA